MKHILFTHLLIISLGCFGQAKQYLYYFDKDLHPVKKGKAVFYGTGEYEGGRVKLILYNNTDKHLILVEHFTDSTLQVNDGLFQSYFSNTSLELEGNFIKGKEDGLWKKWDEQGRIIDSSIYENGQKIVEAHFTYNSKGTLMSKTIRDIKNNKNDRTFFDEKGVMVFDTPSNKRDEDKVFTKTEVEASFPGGAQAWTQYVQKQVEKNSYQFKESDYGTCLVKFIVDRDGSISDVEALSMKDSRLARVFVKAIAKGPKWVPAMQNGRYVKAYRIQPVTLSKPN